MSPAPHVRVNSFIPMPLSERETNWAGLCLADEQVLSAQELHAIFTEEDPSPAARLTRLMVLCACSSGTRIATGWPERARRSRPVHRGGVALRISFSFFLSALVCSGRGYHRREGVQGFARAALAGGIPCLVATKWVIPMKESIILMTLFYYFMALNKVRASAALFGHKMMGGGGNAGSIGHRSATRRSQRQCRPL